MAEILPRSYISSGFFLLAITVGGSWLFAATKSGSSQSASADAVTSDQSVVVAGSVKSISATAIVVQQDSTAWSFAITDATTVTQLSEHTATLPTAIKLGSIVAGDRVSVLFRVDNGATPPATSITLLTTK